MTTASRDPAARVEPRPAGRRFGWLRQGIPWALVALPVALRATPPFEINHDCAWFLLVAERVWTGDRLYVDIVDVNPPWIVYLTMIPVWIAGALGVGAAAVFKVCVLAVAAGAVLAARVHPALRRPGASAALFAVLVVYPGGDFGQREHLTLMGLIPYLLLRAQPGDQPGDQPGGLPGGRPGPLVGVCLGVLAGLGCALKPFFLLVPLAVTCLGPGRDRWGRRWQRPENLGLAGVCLVYGAHFLFVPFRAAFFEHVGVVAEVYAGLRVSPGVFFSRPWTLHAGFTLVGLALGRATLGWWGKHRAPEIRPVLQVFGLAVVGCLLAAAWQGKGWSYHLLPAEMLGVLGLLLAGWQASPPGVRGVGLLLLCGWCSFALGQHWVERDPTTGGLRWSQPFTGIPEELAGVRRLRPGESVLVLDTNMHTFWAYLVEHRIGWASREACLWRLPGTPRDRRGALRADVLADLSRYRPDLIYVRRGPLGFMADEPDFDLLAWLRADGGAVWEAWERAPDSGSFAVFRRR